MTYEAVTRPQLRMFARGPGPVLRSGPVPDALLAFALSMVVLYPTTTAQLQVFLGPWLHFRSSIAPLVVVMLLIWVNGVLERQEHAAAARGVIALMVTYCGGITILTRLVARVADTTAATTLERVLLLLPLSAAVGWILVRTGTIIKYLSWLLAVGMITVLPAIYENLANVSLINSSQYVRNGQTRAIVGSDRPLVLGAVFLALIPIAMYLCGRYRYLCAIWLYVGVFTTGSNGPELVGAFVLVVCFAPPVARLVLSTWRPLMALLAGIAAFLFVGSIWVWSPQIQGTGTTAASNGYRASLYYLLPRLLQDRPFGYGLVGLPPDTWYIYTASGIVDASRSIDSELVYGVSQFGYPAMLLFAVIAVFGVLATVRNHAIGLSSLSLTLVGLFLSIHSWNSIGSLWFLEFGACVALVVGYDGSRDWTGLYRPSLLRPAEAGSR